MLPETSQRRWIMIAFVCLATAINYLDRQTLSVVAPILTQQFHMSNQAYSRVIFAFMLAYTVMNGVSGALIDRLGTRMGYALTTAWWSIAAMLHAFAHGTWSLGVCRFLLGMGEAGNWPAGVKVVAEWFPARERALAGGIFNSGSAIGAVLAPPLVVWIVHKAGWRAAFFLVGAIGLVWVFAWLPVYHAPVAAQQERKKVAVPFGQLLPIRFVWSFTAAKIFLDPVWYFYIFWFPQYLNRARGFDLNSIAKYAWIPFMVAGAGNLLGGWLAAALLRHGVSVTLARKSAVTVFAVLMTATIPAVLVSTSTLSVALVSVAMLGYTGVTANMLAFPADVFPSDAVASIWGIASMGSGFGGMVFALATGWLVDHYSYRPVFFGFGMMPFVALLIMWLVVRPLQASAVNESHSEVSI